MNKEKAVQITDIANAIMKEDIPEIDEKIFAIVYSLTEERKKQKITQEQLAHLSGLTKNTISRIETLVSIPTLPAILKIASALKLEIGIVNR